MEEKKEQGPVITRANMGTPEACLYIGGLAARSLELFGQATFVISPEGDIVVYANPTHIFIHPDATREEGGKNYRLVRPILGSGRPQYAAWHQNELWEVEFLDESGKVPSGKDH